MSTKPLTISLDPALWDDDAVARLVKQGHTIFASPNFNADVIIGRNTWRIPASVPFSEVYNHIDMIIKQMRILLYADVAPSKSSSRGAAAKPKKVAVRKQPPATQDQGVGGTVVATNRVVAPEQLDCFGNGGLDLTPVKAPRKKKGIPDGNEGC